jgi:hypothetical protein
MKKNTKIILGLVVLGGAIYLMKKKGKTETPALEEEGGTESGGGFGGGGIGGGGMPVMGNRTTAPTTPSLEVAKPSNLQSSTSNSVKTAEEGVSKSTLADAQNMINWGIAPMRTFIITRYPTAPIEAVNKAGSQIVTFQKSNSGMSGAEANPKIIAMIDSLIKPVITAMTITQGSGSAIGRPNVGGA